MKEGIRYWNGSRFVAEAAPDVANTRVSQKGPPLNNRQ